MVKVNNMIEKKIGVSLVVYVIQGSLTLHNVCTVLRGICNTPGNVQYTEGYHEYIRGSSVQWGTP